MKPHKFLLTSLLAAAAMSAVPAWATDYTYSASSFTESSKGAGTNVAFSAMTGSDTLTFTASSSGYFPGYSDGSFDANLVINSGATVTINNGTSTYGKTQTFGGSLSGGGNFTLGSVNQTKATTYIFTGNVTGFTGNIDASVQLPGTGNNTGGGIRFGKADAEKYNATAVDGIISNISGRGTITAGNTLTYNYLAGAEAYTTLEVTNTSISARTLTFGGGANYVVSSAVSGNNATASNNTLTISAGTTTFTGAVSNFGNVTVASGATLAVGMGGTLNLSGATVTLGSSIQNTGVVTFSDTSVVEVGALNTFFNASQTGAQNFSGVQFVIATGDGSVSGLTAGSIRVNGVTYANTTIAEDNKSGTVSGSVYNIALGDSASISDVSSAGTFDYVNVFGTLTGFGATAFSSPVTGSGTVEFSSLSSKTITLANWTGTVVFKNISNVNNVGLTLSDYGSKIRFDGLEGRVTTTGSSGLWFNSGTVNADIEIASGGLKVTNGTTNITTTFAGKLTGTGTFEYTRAINQTFKFTGNFSEFTGTLKSSDVATGFFELANTGDMTFNGNFDNANFRKSAPGVLTIANAGTFKNIEQNGGGLKFSGSGTTTIGLFKTTGSTSNVVTIDSGATLDVTTWNQAYTISTLTVNGDLNVSGVMTLATGGETNNITGTGNLTVGTLTTYNVGTYVFSGVNLKIGSGGITAGTRPLSFGQMIIGVKDGVTSWTAARGFTLTAASGTTFSPTEKAQSINLQGAIDGSGKLVKTGAGTLTLSKANTYAGGTTIEGGRLVAANVGALGSGTTKVERGAELGLVAGTAVKVTNGIDLASGAKLVIDMTGVVAGSEEIVLTLISNTALKYNETAFDPDCTSLLGSVVVLENLSGTLSAWTQSLSYSGNTLQLTMAIPEPSAFGLLAGLGALALAGTRRRRKKA